MFLSLPIQKVEKLNDARSGSAGDGSGKDAPGSSAVTLEDCMEVNVLQAKLRSVFGYDRSIFKRILKGWVFLMSDFKGFAATSIPHHAVVVTVGATIVVVHPRGDAMLMRRCCNAP